MLSREHKIYYTLRIAIAMCFIGHGAFGIITKQIWCNYFGVFGIGTELSYTLMPIVGMSDILLGLAILFYPSRFIPVWLVFWGLITAFCRPLSGEPFAEVIERAGNYGAPFALLFLAGLPITTKNLFGPIYAPAELSEKRMKQLTWILRIIVFLLLAGHGWLNLIQKQGLLDQYARLGFSSPVQVAQFIGAAEILAAFAVLIRPVAPLVIALFVWKMASEIFYPHYAVFEWIERGGSYGCLLALWFAIKSHELLREPLSPAGGSTLA
ncbi:MAG: hypothetical protein J7497_03765 [Chitinophagaceae bacterium]|nr:hypothetical protein [Chitinophagaceae bacterium]